jgi:hypothetical protein
VTGFAPSPITDLLNGFAQHIADADIGFTYRADGSAYTDGEVGIYKGVTGLNDGPQLVLNWVALDDALEDSRTNGYLQAAAIGAPNDADSVNDMSSALRTVLHGLEDVTFGRAHVIQCYRSSSVPMGTDEQDRAALADHYTCDVDLPPTVNPPA